MYWYTVKKQEVGCALYRDDDKDPSDVLDEESELDVSIETEGRKVSMELDLFFQQVSDRD